MEKRDRPEETIEKKPLKDIRWSLANQPPSKKVKSENWPDACCDEIEIYKRKIQITNGDSRGDKYHNGKLSWYNDESDADCSACNWIMDRIEAKVTKLKNICTSRGWDFYKNWASYRPKFSDEVFKDWHQVYDCASQNYIFFFDNKRFAKQKENSKMDLGNAIDYAKLFDIQLETIMKTTILKIDRETTNYGVK